MEEENAQTTQVVKCTSVDCIHNKDEKCDRKEVSINDFYECNSYDEGGDGDGTDSDDDDN